MKEQKIGSSDTGFCDDVLIEIFHRLPAKSLFRFKSVSKQWCNLISNDSLQRRLRFTMSGFFHFVSRIDHDCDGVRKAIRENKYAAIRGEGGERIISDMNLDFLPCSLNMITVIDSCNGLLLCRGFEVCYICNPVTKEWFELPTRPTSNISGVSLVFYPDVSLHFKVVWIVNIGMSSARLLIFSSDTGKCVDHPITQSLSTGYDRCINGAIDIFQRWADIPSVVGINLKGKTWRTIKLPERNMDYGVLRLHGGYLYYITNCCTQNSNLEVWILKNYYSDKWILKYNIRGQALLEKLSPQRTCRHPRESVLFVQDFHPDLKEVILETYCRALSFNLESMKLEEICGWEYDQWSSFWALAFTPCFKSLPVRRERRA